MKIKIVSQDSEHQYDSEGNAITTWNEKYCGWVINSEFEDDIIDWQDDINGISEFPCGATEAHFKELYPNAENYPDIDVTWFWDEEGYIKAFHEKPTRADSSLQCSRSWGYLDYTEEKAIELLGHYCDFNKFAYRTWIIYNGKTIFDGILE